MLKRLAPVMAATFLMTAAAEGQTAADIRAGVAEVVVSETEFFGELYLQAEAFPSYNVADGSLGVTLTSQGNLARCTYRNPGPIYEGELTNTLLAGQIDCFGGARFPLDRLEAVTAEIWGIPLECRFSAEETEPGVTAVWECRLFFLDDSPEDSLSAGVDWWGPPR